MKFEVGPTGSLLEGHLYDVNKHSLLRTLQDYDSFLYLSWNPEKRRGLGCWELRRRPEKKTAIYCGEVDGMPISLLEPVESDMIHHVLDIPFLNYQVLGRLKDIDAWNDKNWVDTFEKSEKEAQDTIRTNIDKELRYSLKQDNKIFRVFKDMVASGVNPNLLAHYWGKSVKA